LIGWVVAAEIGGMMYPFRKKPFIIIIDIHAEISNFFQKFFMWLDAIRAALE
jgi:hypothetical protein